MLQTTQSRDKYVSPALRPWIRLRLRPPAFTHGQPLGRRWKQMGEDEGRMLSPFCSSKLHSNYTILIRGTFKSFQFQVEPCRSSSAAFHSPLRSPSAYPAKVPAKLVTKCAYTGTESGASCGYGLRMRTRGCARRGEERSGTERSWNGNSKKLTYVRPEHFSGNSRATFFPFLPFPSPALFLAVSASVFTRIPFPRVRWSLIDLAEVSSFRIPFNVYPNTILKYKYLIGQ